MGARQHDALDIASVSTADGLAEWYKKTGSDDSPIYDDPILLTEGTKFSSATTINTADVDNDGDLDFIVGAISGCSICSSDEDEEYRASGKVEENRRILIYKNEAI